MLTFKRLITLVVPSSILGLSWFWWRWKNKSLQDHSDENNTVSSCDATELSKSNTEYNQTRDYDIDNDKYSLEKCVKNESVDTDKKNNIENMCPDSSGSDIDTLSETDLPSSPCLDKIEVPELDTEPIICNNEKYIVTDEIVYDNTCEEEEITVLMVNPVECEQESENSLDERSHSIISQLSVDCLQEDLVCDEFSPVHFNTPGKRIRNQSSCGDSAIVEDYSSDALSITGSDSAIKSSEGEVSAMDCKPLIEEQCFKKESGRSYRDWYGPSIGSSDFKEKPEKSRHWGSLPVSDTDSDSECILKRTAKIGSVSLDKLSIQLNEELSKVKSSSEKMNSSKSSRYPKQSRKRNRKSESRSSKKQAPPKQSPQKNKNESNHRQRKKNNCGSPKKDMDKPWRNHENGKRNDKIVVDENEKRVTVEYEFPDDMCGRLIGKAGRHISEFKESSGVDICIECELHGKNRIVSMTGVFSQIMNAEKLLNEKFHDSLKLLSFPDISEVEKSVSIVMLPDNTEFNVVVTAIIDVGNFYVQLCNRDVEERLTQLQTDMYGCYLTPRQKYIYMDKDLPKVGEYCVSFIDNVWCRLKIIEVYPETRMVDAFFIDYGGNVNLSIEIIWRMRSDLLQQTPAQAVLCHLNNAVPVIGTTDFSYEANDLFYQVVGGKALQASVSWTKDEIPHILLSYFDEERGEMFSVLEQMQLWGLVQDESIPQYEDGSLPPPATSLQDECLIKYERQQDDSTKFVESLLNCSAPQFICAS